MRKYLKLIQRTQLHLKKQVIETIQQASVYCKKIFESKILQKHKINEANNCFYNQLKVNPAYLLKLQNYWKKNNQSPDEYSFTCKKAQNQQNSEFFQEKSLTIHALGTFPVFYRASNQHLLQDAPDKDDSQKKSRAVNDSSEDLVAP